MSFFSLLHIHIQGVVGQWEMGKGTDRIRVEEFHYTLSRLAKTSLRNLTVPVLRHWLPHGFKELCNTSFLFRELTAWWTTMQVVVFVGCLHVGFLISNPTCLLYFSVSSLREIKHCYIVGTFNAIEWIMNKYQLFYRYNHP